MKRQSRHRGVDLPRNSFTLFTRGADGRGSSQRGRTPEVATGARPRRPTGAVAVQATGNLRWLCAALQAPGERLVVVNPHQCELISRSGKKPDTQEAEWLGELLAKGLLPEGWMQDAGATRIASLAQAREKLVQLRPVLTNQLTHLLAARGCLLRQERLASARGLAAPVSELARLERDSLGGEIRRLNQSLAKVEELLRARGQRLPGWTKLTSSTGSGAVGLSSPLSPIGTVADFPREEKRAASYGIVPRVHNCNAAERRGHIPKRGATLGRTARVHCARIAARYPPSLQAFYRWLAATCGTGKAIIVPARQLLGVIYPDVEAPLDLRGLPSVRSGERLRATQTMG